MTYILTAFWQINLPSPPPGDDPFKSYAIYILLLAIVAVVGGFWLVFKDLKDSHEQRIKDKDVLLSKYEELLKQREDAHNRMLENFSPIIQESTNMVKELYNFITKSQ